MDSYDQYLQAEGYDVEGDAPATNTGSSSSGQTADWLLRLGTGIATTARDWNKPAPAQARPAAAPKQDWVKPVAIGGAILLVVVVVGMLFKGKG